MMKKRYLGKDKLEVSAIGLGCMGMSEFYGDTDEAENLRVLNRSLDIGVNFWDTANVYGSGANEVLLQKVLKERRDEVVLATKFGIVREDGKAAGLDGSPEYMQESLDKSLKRLGVDEIDLYYLHRRNPGQDIQDIVGGMSRMVEAGKVRYLGLSEVGGETLRRACEVHPITALQSEYSLWSRDIEDTIVSCRELGVGVVPYSPLGRGFLTGAVRDANKLGADDYRLTTPRFQGENFDRNLELLKVIEEVAARHDALPTQVALAWVLAKGDDMVPIPGTKRLKYLEQNAAAADLQLSAEDMTTLDSLGARAAGERYNEMGMSIVDG